MKTLYSTHGTKATRTPASSWTRIHDEIREVVGEDCAIEEWNQGHWVLAFDQHGHRHFLLRNHGRLEEVE